MNYLVTNLSSENNLLTFRLNAPVMIRAKVMMTGAFSQNVGKLFSELKLVTDNLLFIYAEANCVSMCISTFFLSVMVQEGLL